MFMCILLKKLFFFSSRRRHTRCSRDWSSDVCSSDLRSGGRAYNEPDPSPREPGMTSSMIVGGARTPIGRFAGGLSAVPAVSLGGAAIREALARAGEIGRASCREGGWVGGGACTCQKI